VVVVKKRRIGGQDYYYIEHSYREGKTVHKKELYLGKSLPRNLADVERKFLFEVYEQKWFKLFDSIKRNFSKEQKTIPPSLKEKEMKSFAIRFTYDSNRIEGSRLTLRETANLLEKDIAPKEKPLRDIKEAEAHEKVFNEMLGYGKPLSLQTVLYWHKKLFEATKQDIAGKVRQHQVAISGSKFTPPLPSEIQPLLNEFFSWYGKNRQKLHPIELAALVHLKFVTVHPFADGNGRISRLMMNFILRKHGFPMLDIHYENRAGYYTALERSQLKRNDAVFLQWFFRRYVKEHKKYIQ